MLCTRCKKRLRECDCPDIDQRLRELSDHPLVAVKWCRCETPRWTTRMGGVTMDAVPVFEPNVERN